MRHIRLVLLLALPILFCVTFNSKRGILPPFGKLLDPVAGFWQNCVGENAVPGKGGSLDGLKGKVSVVYDERHVPHIFADNAEDLYFMQGYVTARDRLFQMDLQTRAAAGRLSEVIDNPAVLRNDRMMRRWGMPTAAANTVAAMRKNPQTALAVDAYTAGVNKYIGELCTKGLPFEYKLLNFRPEPWTDLKCGYLLKLMSRDLTGHTRDMEKTNALLLLGDSLYAQLYPNTSTDGAPIIPNGTSYPYEIVKIDTPASYKPLELLPNLYYPEIDPHNGSNNWAVAGKKTKEGYPILCNDPHLGLRMPSLWYEVQLNAPGINCYGVSLPGSPGVIIGFNDKIAWGVTNASRDVLDWYHISFQDPSRKAYQYNGAWKATEVKVEEIKLANGKTYYDTVLWTHHGPVVYDRNFGQEGWPGNIAMRWAAHDTSNECLTFLLLNSAQNYDDYRNAISHFTCPGQNFIFAAQDGDVAITQQGRFPVKWPHQGEFLLDGSQPLHEWQGYIPFAQNPTIKNPERGFVSSANQFPADTAYPYNQAGNYEQYRNRRINDELEKMSGITPEDMMKFQNDNFNLKAADFLPTMLKLVNRNGISPEQTALLADLEKWNYINDAEQTAPTVWEEWWDATFATVCSDELGSPSPPADWPNSSIIGGLLVNHPAHSLIDDHNTPQVETAGDILKKALDTAWAGLQEWQAENAGKDWKWFEYNNVSVQHLLRLAPLGHDHLYMGGNSSIINATRKNTGASWRMIIQMGPEVKAWGVYPGGPSGNPGSKHYDTYVPQWAAGQYNELHLYPNADNAKSAGKVIQEFQPQ